MGSLDKLAKIYNERAEMWDQAVREAEDSNLESSKDYIFIYKLLANECRYLAREATKAADQEREEQKDRPYWDA